MPIDPNIIFGSRLPLTYDQMQQNKLHLQGMDIANQTNQIALDQAKESQAFQKALNEALRSHSSPASDAQPPQPLTSGTNPAADSDGTGSASLGKDAYGNLVPKIGVESPSGNGVPDNMTDPPGVLTAAGRIPGLGAAPYQAQGTAPTSSAASPSETTSSSGTTSSAATDNGQPQAASGALQSGVNPPQQSVASIAAATGNSPSATAAGTGYATVMGPNGKSMTLPTTYAGIQTNWDKVMSDLTDKGYGVQAMAANAQRAKAVMAGLQMQEAQFKAEAEKMKTFGSIAGSVSTVSDWTDQNQIAMAKASAQNAIQLGMQKGVIEPHHAVALLQAIEQNGYTPQIQEEIQQSAKMGMDSYQQYQALSQHMRDWNTMLNDQVTRKEKLAKLPGELAEGESKEVSNWSGRLANALKTGGPAAYREMLASAPENVQTHFSQNPADVTEVEQAGMNPGQLATDRRAAATLANTQQHQAVMERQGAQRIALEGQRANIESKRLSNENSQMSQQALDNAANTYNMTGQMPNVGISKEAAKLKTQIMNRAAELGGGVNLAGNKAAYQANAGSLRKIQGQFDATNAFENTAFKNLNVFLNQSKKVIDTGSPWINKPLQSVMRTGLGDDDQTAFDTARQTAITEIAKVLGNPQGGGQLSDSQRHEVENLIKPGATFKQIYKAANILKQDMENRKSSYQDQIADIQKRMNVIGQGVTPQNKNPSIYKHTATGPNNHKIGSNDGVNWVDLTTGQKVQ